MGASVHLIKLCVGAEQVEDLLAWQARPEAQNAEGLPCHVTRMWPKRTADLLPGGSLYWVFKGLVLARQEILRLDPVMGGDGVNRCGIVLNKTVVRTVAQPKRPFQGWRYLPVGEAPADLSSAAGAEPMLPRELALGLAEIGVLQPTG